MINFYSDAKILVFLLIMRGSCKDSTKCQLPENVYDSVCHTHRHTLRHQSISNGKPSSMRNLHGLYNQPTSCHPAKLNGHSGFVLKFDQTLHNTHDILW